MRDFNLFVWSRALFVPELPRLQQLPDRAGPLPTRAPEKWSAGYFLFVELNDEDSSQEAILSREVMTMCSFAMDGPLDQYQQAVIQDWHKRHREMTYSRKWIGTRENHKCSEENERGWAVPVPVPLTMTLTMDQYHWLCWTSFPPCSSSCLMCLITRGDPSPLAVT